MAAEGLPFPAEADWLAQELPAELAQIDPSVFVERILQARSEEAQLDRDLAQIAPELPRLLLDAFATPPPGPLFAARVTDAIAADRRSRWQRLLARYVAPEPSPAFIARTVAALLGERGEVHARRDGHGSLGPRSLAHSGSLARWPLRLWPWLTIAAAGVLWWTQLRTDPLPLERRIAAHSAPSAASRFAESPLSAVLAAHAEATEPKALANGSPDGVWLLLARAR